MKRVLVLMMGLLLLISFAAFAGGQDEEKVSGPREVKITLWARANEVEHMRADAAYDAVKLLNKELKAEGSDVTVVVEANFENPSWGDYKKKFTLAADAGEGPDIILSGHEDVPVWANAEYIMPIADSVKNVRSLSPEFADVIESLWTPTQWKGNVWAVPQDTEARPLFYSIPKLKDLGWSDAEITALPENIKKGNFTLDDLIATAKKAVATGVVEEGYGYWHRPRKGGDYIQYYFSFGGYLYDSKEDKLVIVKDALEKWYAFQRECVTSGITPGKYIGTEWRVWHDTVTHNKALFWNGGIWQWADWAKNYVGEEGGEAVLFKNIGYALQPTGISGGKGGTLSHPLVYMRTTENASKRASANTPYVLRLLAKMTTKEINTKHALESTHMGILESQASFAPYMDEEFLSSVNYMTNHNYYQPNHTMYSMYFDAIWDGMVAAETGGKTPVKAAEQAVELLKIELGDALIVK